MVSLTMKMSMLSWKLDLMHIVLSVIAYQTSCNDVCQWQVKLPIKELLDNLCICAGGYDGYFKHGHGGSAAAASAAASSGIDL